MRGLDAGDAVKACRDSNGPATIAAGRDGAQTGGQGGARTAAGTSGSAIGIPRITARVAQLVLGHTIQAKLGRVGLSKDDGPGLTHSFNYYGIHLRCAVSEDVAAQGGGNVLGHLKVLNGNRDTVKRAKGVSSLHRLLRSLGLLQCLVGAQRQVGVQLGIKRLDPGVEKLHQLNDRHLFVVDQLAKLQGGSEGEVCIHVSGLL